MPADKKAVERRAPMQGEGPYWHSRKKWPEHTRLPGTIAWSEHLEIYEAYAAKNGREQSAERLAERGGFGYLEATELLERELRTWRVSK